jgi:hypothetical protein
VRQYNASISLRSETHTITPQICSLFANVEGESLSKKNTRPEKANIVIKKPTKLLPISMSVVSRSISVCDIDS